MSIISFIKDAGEHLFHRPHPSPDIRPLPGKPAAPASARCSRATICFPPGSSAISCSWSPSTIAAISVAPKQLPGEKAEQDALEANAARAIHDYIAAKGLPAEKLDVDYDADTGTVTVSGSVPDQATREKVVVCCGNVASVAHVNDQLSVTSSGVAGEYYTVKPGDTLSRIAKQHYGDGDRYNAIFEANKPMLGDPDKIYPGQVLRIPKLS